MAVVHGLVENALAKVVDYCSRDETRQRLESQVLAPAMRYLADKFAWGARLFQAVAILMLVQTLLLMWLLWRSCRAPPAGAFP